ncbi:MAG: radical SAM protein, partial [Nitrospirota bacterium]|nr:radical SAM protein [Nitrospirota bacterium]
MSGDGPRGKDRPELTLDEVRKISSSMGSLLWLAYSGGEIFLRDDIVEITKVFYENNRPAIILFPTNGLLTDIIRERIEEVLRHCSSSTIVVKLSLDGPEDLHDGI